MPELNLPQSAEDRALLEHEAKRLGITPEQLAKDAMQREMTIRTKPRTSRGVVQPFRRREKD